MKYFTVFLIFLPTFSIAEQDQKIDREEVRLIIRKNLNSIKTCYDDGLKNNPNIQGKIVIEWDLASDGSVSKAAVKSSELKSETVENCIVNKIKALKFPASPTGTIANISYPFSFSKSK